MPWAGNLSSAPSDYLAITCFLEADDAPGAAQMFLDFGLNGVEWEDGLPIHSPFTDIPLDPKKPSAPFVRGYFPLVEEFDGIKEKIEQIALEQGWTVTVRLVRTEDWEHNWKKYYQPIYLRSGYVVIPEWADSPGVDADHGIFLDPGMAFGTGSHPTTFMCMNEMITLNPKGLKILDLGAGSGILTILAARMHAGEIWAVEPDPVAYRALEANIRRNGAQVHTVLGTLQDVSADLVFDLALLNLIADIIVSEWPRLLTHPHPGSRVLLSGILWERRCEVTHMVEQFGGHVVTTVERGGWAMMVAVV